MAAHAEREVAAPGETLGLGLLHLWPSYLADAISFVVLSAIWLDHHAMFDVIVRGDHGLLLLKHPTLDVHRVLTVSDGSPGRGVHSGSGQGVATAFYAGTLTVIGVLVTVMWRHAASHRDLLSDAVSQEEAKAIGRGFLVGPTGYGFATALAFANPWPSIVLFVALNAYFLWRRGTSITS